MEFPTVTFCPNNITATTTSGQLNAVVTWSEPQATDNSGQSPTITCVIETGSQFWIGQTDVTCQVVDPSGNGATCAFTVIIGNG